MSDEETGEGMRIGFYNACLLGWDLDRTLAWAAANGFEGVEVHGGPRWHHMDWQAIAHGRVNPIADAVGRHGVPVVGIMDGGPRLLSPDPGVRKEAWDRLETLLRAAARSGVPVVSTFTGRDPARTLEDQLDDFERVFTEVADLAERHEVALAFENCPMYEFWPYDRNIAVSPVIWEEMFQRVPSRRLGLNLDPSHLVWQGIDYVQAVHDFADRILLAQAKDTETLPRVLRREGMLTMRWWRHRIPGQGDIDWSAFLTALHEIGYGGVLSIEHEDPVWSGDEGRVTRGLLHARDHLERYR